MWVHATLMPHFDSTDKKDEESNEDEEKGHEEESTYPSWEFETGKL